MTVMKNLITLTVLKKKRTVLSKNYTSGELHYETLHSNDLQKHILPVKKEGNWPSF